MILGCGADIVIHHVHQIDELDFLERYPFALDRRDQGVDAAAQLDLFPVKEEEQLAGIRHGIHFFLRPDVTANNFRQRRIRTGNGHRRSCDDARDAPAVLGCRVGLRFRADDLIDEVDDSFRIRRAVRQDGLDALILIRPHPLDPGRDGVDVVFFDVRDDQVIEALVLDGLEDIGIIFCVLADDFGDDFFRTVHVAAEGQFQLLTVAVREFFGDVICRIQVHFRLGRQGFFFQDQKDNTAFTAFDGTDAFFFERDIDGWHFHGLRLLSLVPLMQYLHDFCRFFFFLGVIVLEGQRQTPAVIVRSHQLLTHRHDREIAGADFQSVPE